MCVCPDLLNSSDFPSDAKATARKILNGTRGPSMGMFFSAINSFIYLV